MFHGYIHIWYFFSSFSTSPLERNWEDIENGVKVGSQGLLKCFSGSWISRVIIGKVTSCSKGTR